MPAHTVHASRVARPGVHTAATTASTPAPRPSARPFATTTTTTTTTAAASPHTGPVASATAISDELLAKLATLSTQSLIDGLWVMGWGTTFIEGARPLAKGMKCAGRAVTVQFMPHRPDLAADKPGGESSPEYQAFELCGPTEVLVMSSVGKWESVGGDIKFLRLKQNAVGGLVTDGSVRDTDELINYGFPVFSFSTTPKQGPAAMQPWQANAVINCGGVVVRPGDAVVGDQDGVVVVPASVAAEVYDIAHAREEIEAVIKTELETNPGPPGKYYPFKPPISSASPLGSVVVHFFSLVSARWRGLVHVQTTTSAYPGTCSSADTCSSAQHTAPPDTPTRQTVLLTHRRCCICVRVRVRMCPCPTPTQANS